MARTNIATARATMHQGPNVLRLSPNNVVLDRLGLLEPAALSFIGRMSNMVCV